MVIPPLLEVGEMEVLPLLEVGEMEVLPLLEVGEMEVLPLLEVGEMEVLPLLEVGEMILIYLDARKVLCKMLVVKVQAQGCEQKPLVASKNDNQTEGRGERRSSLPSCMSIVLIQSG
jgi:hypothetical protein